MPQAQPPSVPATQPEERSAAGKLILYAVFELAGIAVGWALSFYIFGIVFNTSAYNLPPNPTPAQVSAAFGPLFQSLGYIVPVTVVVELLALVTLTLAFRQLSKVDRVRFSLPSTLMIVMLVGVILVSITAIPFIQSIPQIIAQAPTTPGGTPSPAFASLMASLLAYLAFIAIGGLLGLIGVIGGVILGLWRVGSRYDETVIKLGAIFTIIPILNIVAPILVLVGAYQVRNRLSMVQ